MAVNSMLSTECYVDTLVVNLLLELKDTDSANHQHSCNKVCGRLKNNPNFGIGIIDWDKKRPSFLMEFEGFSKGHIHILKHKSKPQFIIGIQPAMEAFLLDVAKEMNIRPEDYGLPNSIETLTEITKDISVASKNDLQRFIKKLKGSPEMNQLRDILQYLLQNQYQSDYNFIKGLL